MQMERIVYAPGQTAETEKCPVGFYHVFVGTPRNLQASSIACPYCEAPMQEATDTDQIARVVQEFERRPEGIIVGVEFVPATHRALQCQPCKQVFTSPKDNA